MKHVAIVGMMGAGKSTTGRYLAQQLRCPFVDSDEVIEKKERQSIVALFQSHGEAYFREKERECIASLLEGPATVISLGGGAWIEESTRKLVQQKAVSFYLEASLPTLLLRVGDGSNRPLLQGQNIAEVLEEKWKARHPLYLQADFTIPTDSQTPERIAFEILLRLKTVPS